MPALAPLLTAPIGVLHTYMMVLEMFLWTTPRGLKAFNLKPDFAQKSKPLAASQGLYNGFLAAGLFWGCVHPVEEFASQLRFFFLSCVVTAGVFGAATANKKILFVQALPGAAAMAGIWLWG